MAQKPETRFIKRVHNEIHSPLITYLKLSNQYRAGVLDVYYEGMGRCMWIEYKMKTSFPRSKFVSGMTELQMDQAKEHYDNNIAVACIVGTPHGNVIMLHRSWELEHDIADLALYDNLYTATFIVESVIQHKTKISLSHTPWKYLETGDKTVARLEEEGRYPLTFKGPLGVKLPYIAERSRGSSGSVSGFDAEGRLIKD